MRRAVTTPVRVLTLGHYGGLPEAAMVLGPLLLIGAFLAIARKGDAHAVDDEADEAGEGPGGEDGPSPEAGRRSGEGEVSDRG